MNETVPLVVDASGWTAWLRCRSLIAGKLEGCGHDAYFLSLHTSTEALFRKTLLA